MKEVFSEKYLLIENEVVHRFFLVSINLHQNIGESFLVSCQLIWQAAGEPQILGSSPCGLT